MRDNLPTMLRAAAKEWRKENKVVATGATRYDAALDEAADAIEELSAYAKLYEELADKGQKTARKLLDAYPRWIPVTERLPELNENVLVYSAHSGLIRIDANIWFDRNATHWMPLPSTEGLNET